jgi:hypothetical protein
VNNFKVNKLGLLVAIRKKKLIHVQGEETEKPDLIVQVILTPQLLEMYSNAESLFLDRMNNYAYNAYAFNIHGDSFKDLSEEELKKDYEKFLKTHEVMISQSPVPFDYLIEDLTTEDDIRAFIDLQDQFMQKNSEVTGGKNA